MRIRLWSAVAAAAVVGALVVAATAASAGPPSLKAGSNKDIVYFSLGLSNPYVVNFQKGLTKVVEKYGYKVTTFDSNFDQSKANQQVQQYLATGKKPAAFVWQPIDPVGGSNSSRLLARVAPVIQGSQLPLGAGAFGFAASNQVEVGRQMGRLTTAARKLADQKGVKLHSKGGNVLYLDGLKGQPASPDRWKGFLAATKSHPFKILSRVYGSIDSDTAYKAAGPAIAKYKTRGIDFIVAFNLATAQGVIRAAKQNGLEIGKTTFLITGDCGGGQPRLITAGSVFGTVVVSGYVEGQVVGRELVQRLATGKVKKGVMTLPVTPTVPALKAIVPTSTTFMAVPAATAKDLAKKYWGQTYAGACLGAP